MADEQPDRFAVFCEAEGHAHPLVLTDLTWGRLIDDVVVPFREDKPFFIDGAPLDKSSIRRVKILRQGKHCSEFLKDFYWRIRAGNKEQQREYPGQFAIRVDSILRETSEDVTSQVLQAFDREIKPKLKDYVPNRKELIDGAFRVFIEGMRLLGGGAT